MKNLYRLRRCQTWLFLFMGALSLSLSAQSQSQQPLGVYATLSNVCETGAVTISYSGGDGTPIIFETPGIMRSSPTSTTGIIERELLNDPKNIVIRATQSGKTVLGDFRLQTLCKKDLVNLKAVDATFPVNKRLPDLFDIGGGTYNELNPIGKWPISITGLPPGTSLEINQRGAAAYTFLIYGTPTAVGTYPIIFTLTDPRYPSQPISQQSTIRVVDDASNPPATGLTLIAPTYNCTTGAFTFNTSGGDGTTIGYQAPGITGPTTNPNQFVDAGLRQAADAKPISLSATQSGVTVTYTWDLRAVCPVGATPPVQTNQDRAILVDFYNATNGPGWTNKTNWLQGDSPCNWFGVTCDGSGRVTRISLSNNNLTGTLPTSLGNLTELTTLGLLGNQIGGSIPASLGNLPKLQNLTLGSNNFSGEIPASLGNLPDILYISLIYNKLSGSIPASLGNLSKLTVLELANNLLNESIPASFSNLSELLALSLSHNFLTGSIPASLGSLAKLQGLDLSYNSFTGSIPASLGSLPKLSTLYLQSNQLSGCFPAELSSLCGKSVLTSLNANLPGGGNFDSFCSTGTGSCTPPSSPPLQLTLPNYNCSTGAFKFNTTGGNGTAITYRAPGITGPTTNPNQFVDAGLRQAADAKPISLSATQSGVTVTYLWDLKAACSAQINSDKAILVDLYNATDGPRWVNKTNWNTGTSPCSWYGISCDTDGRVVRIDLVNNNLNGTIPASLGSLSRLAYLYLNTNKIGGQIPASLGNLSELTTLALSNNQFKGQIPASLSGLSKLTFLALDLNQLSGTIPASLGNLSGLEALLLQNNQLTGSIPASLGNLPKLKSLYLYNNLLSGCFAAELATLCGKDIRITGNPSLPGGGNFDGFCSNRTGACATTPTTGLALTAPTYNCTTGAFTFNTSGGDGTTTEYQAAGITGWTTNPNQFVDQQSRTANDVQPFTLMARQSGKVVTYVWNLKQACGRGRIAAGEVESELSLQLLGNPAQEQVRVLIKGAEGQAVQLRLTNFQGRLLESRTVNQAGAAEEQHFQLDQSGPGVYLIQATKAQQIRTLKVIKN